MNALRELFRPKRAEVPVQCASCPFRIGNHKEFGAVVDRLRRADGATKPASKNIIRFARVQLLAETMACGDFMCHGTVYDAAMKKKPIGQWRQCKGATEFYRHGKFLK